MPRTLQEILDSQDEIAKRFEDYEPDESDKRDPEAFRALLGAAAERATSEVHLAEAVATARAAGYTWAVIGAAIGTTGQAAQQRYGGVALISRA